MTLNAKSFLTSLFNTAVKAAYPETVLSSYLPIKPKGRTIVIGAGKGAAQMAVAFEKLWKKAGYDTLSGAVVTRYGYGERCQKIKIFEAAHPVPDEAGLKASQYLMNEVRNLNEDDLVIALICGGGSALLPAPLDGLTLADEQAVNAALLKSGAPIRVMNAIRKHISSIKGGRLAALAAPAKVISLIISDIPGDNPALVSSGPTVPDNINRYDALKMIENYKISLPYAVCKMLHSNKSDAPKPDDMAFQKNEVHIIASTAISLEAARQEAEAQGVKTYILSDAIEGEAKDIGFMHGAITREIILKNQPFQKPVLLLSGGETTVTLSEKGGKGGRNSEFLLAFATVIDGLENVFALAADTDGIDGSETNAGAFADGQTIINMRKKGINAQDYLIKHDSWSAFNAIGELFVTGPTGTNVNDFRAILII